MPASNHRPAKVYASDKHRATSARGLWSCAELGITIIAGLAALGILAWLAFVIWASYFSGVGFRD